MKESQNKAILKHLLSKKPITQMEALELFGCFRLSARIYDLIGQNHPIKSEMITLKNGKRVAQYSMKL